MQRIVVGMFVARRDADRARSALLSEGFADRQVMIEGAGGDAGGSAIRPGERRTSPNEPLPEDRGIAGFIGRMFSGATMDPTGIERYCHAVDTGRALVTVHGLDDEAAARLMAAAVARA